jgi:hypothetical protein
MKTTAELAELGPRPLCGGENFTLPPAMETTMKTTEIVRTTREPAQSASPIEVQNHRLQALVTELLMDNQKLRFKAAELEAEIEKNERSLKAATRWAGMVF